MTEGEMFEKSFQRPVTFFKLSPEEQWAIDKRLGILDWDGGCLHNDHHLCPPCSSRFRQHYRVSTRARRSPPRP